MQVKPKLEDTDPLAKLRIASLVLPRIEMSVVERPTPLLPIAAFSDHDSRLRCTTRPRQAQQRGKNTGHMTAAVRDPEPTPQRRFCGVSEADGFRKLPPRGAEESRVQPQRRVPQRRYFVVRRIGAACIRHGRA